MRKEVLRLERVTYKEQETIVLRDFTMNVFEGEIMGLIPENTYGLSALIDILLYSNPLYDGYVYYRGNLIDSWHDNKRMENRIALIQGKSSLVDGQNAAINIFVLRKGFKQEILQQNIYCKQLIPLLEEIHVNIPVDAPVEKLSSFERIIVELLRAVVANQKLIILNEISTVLSDSELLRLYDILHEYTKKGFSFLYITHWFEEVVPVCDRVSIMKNGKLLKVILEDEMESNDLQLYAKHYELKTHTHEKEQHQEENETAFEAKLWQGEFIHNFGFKVKRGEYLVIQGVENKAFLEFVSILTGNSSTCKCAYWIDGELINLLKDRRIAVIQERAADTMLFWGMSYMDNLCMTTDHRVKGIWSKNRLRKSIQMEYSRLLGEDVFDQGLEELTQIQRYELVYMRVLLQRPGVVFCIQPFKGVDIAYRNRIWELQEMLLEKGIAVVAVALNRLDEVCQADRVIYLEK